jgi:hypothetical protein
MEKPEQSRIRDSGVKYSVEAQASPEGNLLALMGKRCGGLQEQV